MITILLKGRFEITQRIFPLPRLMATWKTLSVIVSSTVSVNVNVCVLLWFISELSSTRPIGSWNPPSGLPSRAPSEPDDIGQFDDDPPSHRGLAGGPFLQHSPVLLPHQVSRESDLSTTYRTTSHSCMRLVMRRFSCSAADMLSFLIVCEQQNAVAHIPSGSVQNAHSNRLSLQKPMSKSDMQPGPLDSRVKGSNNPKICNPDGIRLREVSELRPCLFFRLTS